MPYWLPSVALSLAIIYLWGGTPFWVTNGWLTGGWALVLYAVLVAVPLIVLGVMAFRQRLGNTPPPPLQRRGWRLANCWLGLLLVWSLTVILAGWESYDFKDSLWPWTEHYHALGWVESLRQMTTISNYTPLYNYFLVMLGQLGLTRTATLYAIKYLTLLASGALAVAVALIVAHVRQKPFSWGLVIGSLLLPPVIMESALWAQCDAIYTALCLFAFYAALKHRSRTAMVLVGLAFATKFQFIFIVPVLFLMLIVKDADGRPYLRWRDLWLAPLMYVVNLWPVCFGADIVPILTVYWGQYDGLYLAANAATLPMLTNLLLRYLSPLFPCGMSQLGWDVAYYVHFGLGLLAFGLLLFVASKRTYRHRPDPAGWVNYALLFALSMPFIMPHMHDRFCFMAAVLAMVYAYCQPSRRNFWVMGLVVGSQTLAMFPFLHIDLLPYPWPLLLATIANLVAWFIGLDGLNRTPVCQHPVPPQ